MSDWRITLPYRHRTDPVTSIADAAEALPDREDRDVVRGLALELTIASNITTVGEALDAIDAADPASRRELLDRARERAGLPRVEQAEQRATYEAANLSTGSPSAPMRDGQGRVQALCSEPSCKAFEPGTSGQIAWVSARKWWCAAHRHLAAPGDSEPHRSGLAYGQSGGIVDLDERNRERERAEREAAARQERHERRLAERRSDAERLAPYEDARAAQFHREHAKGVRP